MFLFTGISVIEDTIEVTMAIPAEGPSLGVAPSGMNMKIFFKYRYYSII